MAVGCFNEERELINPRVLEYDWALETLDLAISSIPGVWFCPCNIEFLLHISSRRKKRFKMNYALFSCCAGKEIKWLRRSCPLVRFVEADRSPRRWNKTALVAAQEINRRTIISISELQKRHVSSEMIFFLYRMSFIGKAFITIFHPKKRKLKPPLMVPVNSLKSKRIV